MSSAKSSGTERNKGIKMQKAPHVGRFFCFINGCLAPYTSSVAFSDSFPSRGSPGVCEQGAQYVSVCKPSPAGYVFTRVNTEAPSPLSGMSLLRASTKAFPVRGRWQRQLTEEVSMCCKISKQTPLKFRCTSKFEYLNTLIPKLFKYSSRSRSFCFPGWV